MSVEDDRIEKLKRKLYSRTQEPVLDVRSNIRPTDAAVDDAWGKESTLVIPDEMPIKRTHPFLKKFLFSAALFFLISIAVSAYIFFGGGNLISSNNVDIQVAGPSSVASGDEVDLNLSIVNQNHADLELTRLIIDYPDGSEASADSNAPLGHVEQNIGTVAKGTSANQPIKLFLFGDKDEVKTIKFQIEYQVSGSNAVFTKEKDYDITLGSSPVILNVSAPQEVNSGQDITFQTTISSNSTALLQNVLVSAEYPYGFTYKSSSAKPVAGSNHLWNIGDLKSGDKKTLSIVGTLNAQDGEQRTFRFSVGTKPAGSVSGKDIDTILSQSAPTITVSKPFIAATLSLSGNTADTVAVNPETTVNASLNFTNTLPNKLNDVAIAVNISGSGLNRQVVQAGDGGFYQSANNMINWDKNSTSMLSQMNPSESQNISFSFAALKLPVGVKNPEVDIAVAITGTRTSDLGSVEQVKTTLVKTAKVNTNLMFSAKTMQGGPITNTGPVPPKAESPTTYTIHWALSNTWNDVSGAKVIATLPPYVDWTGNVSPSTANINYNSSTRTITWTPDSVSAGAGFTVSPKEVYFQVKVTPSLSQAGTIPTIISDMAVSAMDNFSGAAISYSSTALTTQTSDTGNQGFVTR